MRVAVLLSALATAVTLCAQTRPDSAPQTRGVIAAIKPVMAKLRGGDTEVESTRIVVSSLLGGEHAIAAPWWVMLATDAQPEAKLLPAERETLTKLRHALERREGFVEERRIILRLIRQTESLVASKDFDDARLAAAASRAFLGLVPDAGLAKLLDAAEKKIPPPKTDDAPQAKRAAWTAGLEAEALAAYRILMEQGLSAYAEAGCRPGRFVLARSIRDGAALLPRKDVASGLDHLRALTTLVEPRSALTLFIRTVGTARFFREGVALTLTEGGVPFDAEKHDPIQIAVVPGDTLTIAFDHPYASDEIARSFVIALHGRFESRDLAPKDLFCDLSEHPGEPGAVLLPVPIAKKKLNPPSSLFGQGREQDEALRAFNTYFELPKTTRRSVDVPCLGDMIMFLQEFETRRLAPVLVGTETDHFAVVIKVPDA